MAIVTFRSRQDEQGASRVLYTGDHASEAAALAHCAANGVSLAEANLRGLVFDGADISGLFAPCADFTGCSMRNVTANRAVAGRIANISASALQGAVITGVLTHIDMSCTHPTALRAELGERIRIRGCDFSDCPDVLTLGITSARGVVIATRNGTGWKVHAGSDNGGDHVLTEAEAHSTLGRDARYARMLEWLASAEGQQAKAAIDARPIGTGSVTPRADGGTKIGGAR